MSKGHATKVVPGIGAGGAARPRPGWRGHRGGRAVDDHLHREAEGTLRRTLAEQQ